MQKWPEQMDTQNEKSCQVFTRNQSQKLISRAKTETRSKIITRERRQTSPEPPRSHQNQENPPKKNLRPAVNRQPWFPRGRTRRECDASIKHAAAQITRNVRIPDTPESIRNMLRKPYTWIKCNINGENCEVRLIMH